MHSKEHRPMNMHIRQCTLKITHYWRQKSKDMRSKKSVVNVFLFRSKDIDLKPTSKSNKEIIDNVSKTSIRDEVSIEMLTRLQEEIVNVNKTLNYIKMKIDHPEQLLSPAIRQRSSINRFLQN